MRLDKTLVSVMCDVRSSLKRLGFNGARLDALTARLVMPRALGFHDRRIARARGETRLQRSPGAVATDPLDEGLHEFVTNGPGAEFLQAPAMVEAAAGVFRKWAVTPDGLLLARVESHAKLDQRRHADATIAAALFGADATKKPAEGPRLADLPDLPSLRPGEVAPLEWLVLRDQRAGAAKREEGPAIAAFLGAGPVPSVGTREAEVDFRGTVVGTSDRLRGGREAAEAKDAAGTAADAAAIAAFIFG